MNPKKSVTKFFLGFLLLVVLVWAQQMDKNGVVDGNVLNISQDSSAVTNQEVLLFRITKHQEKGDELAHTTTDDQGRFIFDNLEINEETSYYPVTIFDNIKYSGNLVNLNSNLFQKKSDIFVFDTTMSDSTISIVMYHVIIESGTDDLSVREIILFSNSGLYTYNGTESTNGGKNIVLEMEVPDNSTGLQLGGDLMSCCAIVSNNKIFDSMELKPGFRQITLNYRVPIKGKNVKINSNVHYPVKSYDIFLSDPLRLNKLTVDKEQDGRNNFSDYDLQNPEDFRIRDGNYARYTLAQLEKGDRIYMSIINLPVVSIDYKKWAPVLLVLLILLGYGINHRRNKDFTRNPAE